MDDPPAEPTPTSSRRRGPLGEAACSLCQRRLAANPDGYCRGCAAAATGPDRLPEHPTDILPGPAKVEVLAARFERGERLWHPDDAKKPEMDDLDRDGLEKDRDFKVLRDSMIVVLEDGRRLPAGRSRARANREMTPFGKRGRPAARRPGRADDAA